MTGRITEREISRRDALKAGGAFLGSAALGGCANMPGRGGGGFPRPNYITTNGIKMAVYQEGEGFPVVFSHGFPELAYSWRKQLPAIAAAGYHAIAPDQRGYGLTDRPEDVTQYDIHHLTGDLVGLLDHYGYEKAIFCGHDWGGAVVWNMATLHPDRVAGVIGVNTPFMPRTPIAPIQMLRATLGENNYMVFFQRRGVADAVLASDVDKTFRVFLRKGGTTAEEFNQLPADAPERSFDLISMIENAAVNALPGELLVSEKDLAHYVKTYERTGFTGGINWYRNIDRNWETTADAPKRVTAPSLYIGAEDDVVLPPSMAAGMETFVPDLEKQTIADCGHWTQQEKPEEMNAIVLDWLGRRFPAG